MDRRAFTTGLGALLAAPTGVGAQQAVKTPRIGILWSVSSTIATPWAAAFRQELGRLGYVESQSILLEERWADGRLDRLASRGRARPAQC